jgi:hypothetical protein
VETPWRKQGVHDCCCITKQNEHQENKTKKQGTPNAQKLKTAKQCDRYRDKPSAKDAQTIKTKNTP